MREILIFCLAKDLRYDFRKYIKQAVFLIPIISITLMFASIQNIKFINQSIFLGEMRYSSIQQTEEYEDVENCFAVYTGEIAVIDERNNVKILKNQYYCEVFNAVGSEFEFENTYFSFQNLNFDAKNLSKSEIIISYDIAQRLDVGVGDTVWLINSNGNESLYPYTVVSIMKTKYSYQNIGSEGTVLISDKSNHINLIDLYSDNGFKTFLLDSSGDILLSDEKDEASVFSLPTISTVVINIIFPILSILLITLVVARESGNLFSRKKKYISLLFGMGMPQKSIIRLLNGTELVILTFSTVCALLIYKFILLQQFIGQYVPWRFMLILMLVCLAAQIVVIHYSGKYIEMMIGQNDLCKLLQEKGD